MADQQKLSEMTTEELARRLVVNRFFQSFFRTGKDPEFWARAVREVEEELARRRALT